jgi:hypothetical protein
MTISPYASMRAAAQGAIMGSVASMPFVASLSLASGEPRSFLPIAGFYAYAIMIALGMLVVAHIGDERLRRRERLLTIIAAAYQIAGVHGVPARVLDVLARPEAATDAQVAAMLPYALPNKEN